MERKLAKQFARMMVQVHEPRAGFDMYVAVWSKPGHGECVIGAPSVMALAERWYDITQTALDANRAQHVMVIQCDAPESLMDQAKAIAVDKRGQREGESGRRSSRR
jgi:hypothetical protein